MLVRLVMVQQPMSAIWLSAAESAELLLLQPGGGR